MTKNHTHLCEFLGEHFHPYITNKRIHGIHHPLYSQMKKGQNNIFAYYPPKSSTYSKTTNMITFIVLDINFHSSRYEDIFKNPCIHLGVNISESLSLHIHIMNTRRQYSRVYKKNAHIKMLRDQILKKMGQ